MFELNYHGIQLSNNLSSEDSFHISLIASIIRGGTNNCVFCSNWIRALVAMATYIFH